MVKDAKKLLETETQLGEHLFFADSKKTKAKAAPRYPERKQNTARVLNHRKSMI